MGSCPRAITALCLAATAFSLAAQTTQTTRRRKPRPAPVPKSTAAQRSAAAAKVEQYLEDSAGHALLQPGALVPVFEQFARLAAGQEPKTVHMVHFGDSHTAADEMLA
jgi:hypothetical protein